MIGLCPGRQLRSVDCKAHYASRRKWRISNLAIMFKSNGQRQLRDEGGVGLRQTLRSRLDYVKLHALAWRSVKWSKVPLDFKLAIRKTLLEDWFNL